MKCPYREFQECIVEKCPSCNYEKTEHTIIVGRAPYWMSDDEAIKRGNKWREKKEFYKFVSCRLIDSGATPIPAVKQTINNTTQTNVVVRKSIFDIF